MLIKALILLTLLSFTPHHRDTETWEEREVRLTRVAEAIDDASLRATCQGKYAPPEDDQAACVRLWPGTRKALAMLLVLQAKRETHLSAEIHHNRCRLEMGECDSRWFWSKKEKKRIYVQQSFSLWQLKKFRDISFDDWKKIQLGVDGTEVAAWHAARRLSSGMRACGTVEGAISRYALGHGCKWEHAGDRTAEFYEILKAPAGKLEKEIAAKKARMTKEVASVKEN